MKEIGLVPLAGQPGEQVQMFIRQISAREQVAVVIGANSMYPIFANGRAKAEVADTFEYFSGRRF